MAARSTRSAPKRWRRSSKITKTRACRSTWAWFSPSRPTITKSAIGWRQAGLVGLFSFLGSLGWFSAFALVNAAYVNALGQIEIVFTTLTSVFVLGERIAVREAFGIALIIAGAVLLVLTGL